MIHPTLADVRAAAARLASTGLVKRTPVMTARSIERPGGPRLFFKPENLQTGGAFKIRGALNMLLANEVAARAHGVVAFSSGNHAQGVALAARHLGVRATIVMPTDAPAPKLAATRAYGAEVVLYDRATEDREAIARDLVERTGALLVPPFNHPDIIAGQGTATLELLEDAPDLDAIIVPVGGGGLCAGACLAAQSAARPPRVFGAEPAAGNDLQLSLAKGERTPVPPFMSLADGALPTCVGEIPFAILRSHLAGVFTSTDDELLATMRLLAERMKLVVEPTGALSVAPVLRGALPPEVLRVGMVISGGNVAGEVLARAAGS